MYTGGPARTINVRCPSRQHSVFRGRVPSYPWVRGRGRLGLAEAIAVVVCEGLVGRVGDGGQYVRPANADFTLAYAHHQRVLSDD